MLDKNQFMLLTRKHRWLIEVAVIIFILVAVRSWMQRDIVRGIAPNITHALLDGKPFDLYQESKRPVLIHFWATWCPVCKLEQSNINNIAKDYPVITVAMQSGNDTELTRFMQDEILSFRVINDEFGELSRKYKIKGVPVSLVVNRNNEIEFVEAGYTTELGMRLRLWWAGL